MLTTSQLEKGCQEAIFYWNLYEDYYHRYFVQVNDRINDNDWLEFYYQKIYQAFLRQYSIRRNITADKEGEDPIGLQLIRYLQKEGYYTSLLDGDETVIDRISEKLKETCLVPLKNKNDESKGRRSCISLLSKTAFLVNPARYSLYDNLAKDALHMLFAGIKRNNLPARGGSNYSKKSVRKGLLSQSYEMFNSYNNILIEHLSTHHDFDQILANSLKGFEDTNAYTYFRDNPESYKRRATDKFLWITKYENNSRTVNNARILEFLPLSRKI